MRKVTWQERWRYRFDNMMARGTIAVIGWLALASAALIVLFGCMAFLLHLAPPETKDGPSPGLGALIWTSLLHSLATGTLGRTSGSPAYLALMLTCTLGGVCLTGTFIGLITTGLRLKLDELRKGRSRVLEENHTVILGWSPQVFTVVSELVLANESRRGGCIAILANRDKIAMEDALNARIPERHGTRIVCRSGDPLDATALETVNPQASRSIIVLSPENAKDPDTHVVKTLISLVNSPQRRNAPYHIVAQIEDEANLNVARMVGRDECALVATRDTISRIAVQTSRQSGLSVVFTELMDFGGDEIYFHAEPRLTGKPFRDALFAYPTSTVIGLRTQHREVLLNPPADRVVEAGDQLIVIAADDDTVVMSPLRGAEVDEAALSTLAPRPQRPERILLIGWNKSVPLMIRELDCYLAKGSSLQVVANVERARPVLEAQQAELAHTTVTFLRSDTTDRSVLDALEVWTYDRILTVACSDALSLADADAQTLMTLLHLRDISNIRGVDLSIVSEMLDPRNCELAAVTRVDDFIVSDRLISLLMTQISENKELFQVFSEILGCEGSELYMRPAADYVQCGTPVSFYAVTEAACRRKQIALGYRIAREQQNPAQSYGIQINPDKARPITFSDEDSVIVLAEL